MTNSDESRLAKPASGPETQFVGDIGRLTPKVSIRDKLTDQYHEQCVEKVFRPAWHLLAHIGDLAEPGQYYVYDVPTFKTSVLLVRGEDGKVRGFHNYCRHRAKKIIPTENGWAAGRTRAITCWFHGWTYGHDGALKVVPDESSFEAFDKSQMGLVPIAVEEWCGLVFANFSANPVPFKEWLGELYEGFEGYYAEMERIASFSSDVRANWNVAVDAFSEGYHTVFLHRHTQPDLPGKGNLMRHYPVVDVFERHMRSSSPANPDYVGAPAERLLYSYGRKITPMVESDYSPLPPGVNRTRTSPWFFDIVRLFPNVTLLNGVHWCSMVIVWPIDKNHSRCITEHFTRKARHAGDRLGQAYMRSLLTSVTREDFVAMEQVQEGLESGAFDHRHMSQQEIGIIKRYHLVERIIAS